MSQDLDEGEGLVMAFYYAWYDLSSWAPELCDRPEDPYDSSIPEVIDRHIEQAQGAGIDAFILAWRGPSVTQNPSETNLRVLLARASVVDFAVAVMVDMTTDLLATSSQVKGALIALRDSHMSHAAYMTIDGLPVVYFFGQDRLPLTAWQSLRAEIDPEADMVWIAEGDPGDASTDMLEVFDGIYLYDVAETAQLATLFRNQASEVNLWNLLNQESDYWVATILPGYDNSFLIEDDDDLLQRPRNNGLTYRQNSDAAVASDPDWIVIRSYNEWEYCTQIEPSVTYGWDYLDLTADIILDYRQGLLPPTPTPTVAVASPSPTFTETPEPTVTETATVSATASVTPTATLTPTPLPTLTPSATPFRLATPTPTRALAPGDTRRPEPAATLTSGVPGGVSTAGRPGPLIATMTPVPRLPVEGYPPKRCALLPLFLPAIALYLRRCSRAR